MEAETLTRERRVHREQARFLRSRALYRGFVGGRGSGKTWIGAYDGLIRAQKGRTYLIGSPTGVILHDTTFPTFKALAQETGLWGPVTIEVLPEAVLTPTGESTVKMTPYPTVQLTSGAAIRFRTAEDPEKMRGPNLSGVWLDEASLMKREAYMVCIASLREGQQNGWLSATFTPKGRTHWTYEVFGKGGPDVELFTAQTRLNPFLPPDFAARLATQYHGAQARQELGGEFTDIAGAEFPAEYFDGPGFWFSDWPEVLDLKVMALDPSKGADAKTADYQAIILYGRDRNGTEYVEADMAGGDPATSSFPGRPMVAMRAPDGTALTEGMVDRTLELYARFKPETLAVEVNQFQLLLLPTFRSTAPIYRVCPSYTPLDNRTKKHLRICRLGEPLKQRLFRFRDTPMTRLLVDQLREYSLEAPYDDGPDALEMARRVALELWHGRQSRGPSGWRV